MTDKNGAIHRDEPKGREGKIIKQKKRANIRTNYPESPREAPARIPIKVEEIADNEESTNCHLRRMESYQGTFLHFNNFNLTLDTVTFSYSASIVRECVDSGLNT